MKHIVAALLFLLICTDPSLARSIKVTTPPGAPKIKSDFHSRIGVSGGRRPAPHQGIDLVARNRTPILAAADGTVLETDIGSCWGPTLVIDHGPGPDGKPLIAAYGHVGQFTVQPGQRVKRGQMVARLGNNHHKFRCIGGVRHLHFQLGRKHRSGPKGSSWGHTKYLVDGKRGVNPHLYWADGPGQITCFRQGRSYPKGTLTYPMACR